MPPDLLAAIAGIPGIGPYIPYLMLAVTVAALLAAIMPPPTETSSPAYAALYRFVNVVAANVGHARNAPAPPSSPGA